METSALFLILSKFFLERKQALFEDIVIHIYSRSNGAYSHSQLESTLTKLVDRNNLTYNEITTIYAEMNKQKT